MANPSLNGMTPAKGGGAGAWTDSATFVVPSGLSNSKLIALVVLKGVSTAIPYATALHTRTGTTNQQSFTSSVSLQAGTLEGSAGMGMQVWYLDNPTPGTYFVHLNSATEETGTPNRSTVQVCLAQDIPAGPPNYFQFVADNNDGLTSVSNSLTTTKNNALLFAAWAIGVTGDTITFPVSPYTTLIAGGADSTGSSGIQQGIAYQSLATAGATNPAWVAAATMFARQIVLTFGWDPIAADTCAVTDFVRGHLFQTDTPRTGTTATVPFAGTFNLTSGAVTTGGSAEVQIRNKVDDSVFQTWTPLTSPIFSNPTNGGVTGTMSVPVGGGYSDTYGIYPQIRIKDSGGGIIATSPIGGVSFAVGDIFIVGPASSSGARPFDSDTSLVTPDGRICTYIDPLASGGTTGWGQCTHGAMIYPFGNAFIAYTSRPCAFIDNALSGSTLQSDWVNVDLSPGTVYTTQIGYLTNAGVTKCAALLSGIGNDASQFPSITGGAAGYTSRLATVNGRYRTLMGDPNLPLILYGIQRFSGDSSGFPNPSGYEARVTLCRQAGQAWCDADAHAYYIPRMNYALQVDDTHLTPAEQDFVGTIMWDCYKNNVLGVTTKWYGPGQPTGPSFGAYNNATGEIVATFALSPGATGIVNTVNDGSYTLAPSCFQVFDSTLTAQTITSATIFNAQQVSVIAPSGLGASVTVTHMQGSNPGAATSLNRPNAIWDNGPNP